VCDRRTKNYLFGTFSVKLSQSPPPPLPHAVSVTFRRTIIQSFPLCPWLQVYMRLKWMPLFNIWFPRRRFGMNLYYLFSFGLTSLSIASLYNVEICVEKLLINWKGRRRQWCCNPTNLFIANLSSVNTVLYYPTSCCQGYLLSRSKYSYFAR
jgi:hypothetical protein